jgi:hypothetical protein
MVFSAVLWTRIDFSWLDPDPEGQKKPQEKEKFVCFEVLGVLF